jgi:hypothetical protein
MIATTDTATGRRAAPIYQLKVVLVGTRPVIWRRLHVPGDANLGWLHAVLQVAMGWTNSHLHHFLTRDARYVERDQIDDLGFFHKPPDRDEAKAKLAQIAPGEGDHFRYEYDFGDSWLHEITVEKILPPDAAPQTIAVCLAGARACPPEDCGGIAGFARLLKALENPKHPEHLDLLDWYGGPFDAKTFDVAKTNRWLSKLKWPRVTDAQLRQVLMGRDGYPK